MSVVLMLIDTPAPLLSNRQRLYDYPATDTDRSDSYNGSAPERRFVSCRVKDSPASDGQRRKTCEEESFPSIHNDTVGKNTAVTVKEPPRSVGIDFVGAVRFGHDARPGPAEDRQPEQQAGNNSYEKD